MTWYVKKMIFQHTPCWYLPDTLIHWHLIWPPQPVHSHHYVGVTTSHFSYKPFALNKLCLPSNRIASSCGMHQCQCKSIQVHSKRRYTTNVPITAGVFGIWVAASAATAAKMHLTTPVTNFRYDSPKIQRRPTFIGCTITIHFPLIAILIYPRTVASSISINW